MGWLTVFCGVYSLRLLKDLSIGIVGNLISAVILAILTFICKLIWTAQINSQAFLRAIAVLVYLLIICWAVYAFWSKEKTKLDPSQSIPRFSRKTRLTSLIIAILAIFPLIGTFYVKRHSPIGANSVAINDNQAQFFSARLSGMLTIKFTGPLLYFYNSQLGKTIAPVNIAMFVEVANLKPMISCIYAYSARVLIEYKDNGEIFEEWYPLHKLPLFNNEVYWVVDNDWTKCKRIDFSQNSFDMLVKNTQLQQGQSISGWMLFEIDPKVRGLIYQVKRVEITLENVANDSQTLLLTPVRDLNLSESIITGGELHFLDGYYDLTKEKYTLTPKIDLREILKKEREKSEAQNGVLR